MQTLGGYAGVIGADIIIKFTGTNTAVIALPTHGPRRVCPIFTVFNFWALEVSTQKKMVASPLHVGVV